MRKNWFKLLYIVVSLGIGSCASEQLSPKIDCSISATTIELISSEDASCGESNGAFTVTSSGGQPPYMYTSAPGSNSDGIFTNLSAGNYSVVATDANGCTSEFQVTVQNLDGVNVDNLAVTDAGCGSSNGSIRIDASGGVEPYIYSMNGVEQQDNLFSGLSTGTYIVNIQDQLGCETTQEVGVLSGTGYNNSVKGIIENSCAISGCHNGSVSPDFRLFSTIQSRAGSIKSRTGNKSMPRGSTLSQSQIDLIACWVDDGALDN